MQAAVAATLVGLFVILALLEVPIAFSLGLSALAAILLFLPGQGLAIFAHQVVGSLMHESLMAIPLFIAAGLAFSKSGVASRLVRLARLVVGGLPGGLGVVAVAVSMFFAAMSGSGPATVAAIGSLMIPALAENGYDRGFAAGLLAASGGLGIIIPPSIAMVIYGLLAEENVLHLFIAGVLPGVVVGAALIGYTVWASWRRGYGSAAERAVRGELLRALVAALPGLAAPVVILVCIYGGFSSPTRVAAVAVAYAVAVDVVFYRDLGLRALIGVFREAAIVSSQVLVIVAAASLFAWVLEDQGITTAAVSWLSRLPVPRWAMLLMINAAVLAAGCVADAISIYYIFVPILLPVVKHLGVPPLHFGVILAVNLAIGQVTPPVGVNLFVACGVARLPLERVARAAMPFILAEVAALMVIVFCPALSEILLRLFPGGIRG
ncbi:MAG TPA: TRAP transporter large permease [Planctomycetota bacterium]|nr:TRAP transporter large permease [Planctomycetota bacterium]HRR80970.1 TRAP transporter large permease [Planctomycetota bacterium]HRT94646.1 TRAP transporter large permease [Planctomycetota bacterium]